MRKVLYMMGILDDTDVAWLAEHGVRRTIPQGGELIREGKPVDSLFVLLEGELAVRTHSGGEVARLYSGEIVGEVSFVDKRPPTATVTAVRGSNVLDVPRSALRAKLARDDGFAAHFYLSVAMFLADRLRTAMSRKEESDDLNEELLDNASLGAVRFEKLLRART